MYRTNTNAGEEDVPPPEVVEMLRVLCEEQDFPTPRIEVVLEDPIATDVSYTAVCAVGPFRRFGVALSPSAAMHRATYFMLRMLTKARTSFAGRSTFGTICHAVLVNSREASDEHFPDFPFVHNDFFDGD